MIKNIKDMTTQEIRTRLREIATAYRYYPDAITQEIEKTMKNDASPYLVEVNERALKHWIDAGAELVGRKPSPITFKTITTHGI